MHDLAPAKIFIVEDDEFMAHQNSQNLKIQGEADPAIVIRDMDDFAQTVLDGQQFRVFLVDINLGIWRELEGLEIIKEARKRFPDALIIALSAYEDSRKSSLSAGADYFFKKENYDERMKEISDLVNEHRENNKHLMPTMLFYANVAHVDTETEMVKLDCYMGDLNFERHFQLRPMAAALNRPVEVNVSLEVRVIQQDCGVLTAFQWLDKIPGRPPHDQHEEENPIDLTQSPIWTNKLNDGD